MATIPVDILVTNQGAAARQNLKTANRTDTITWFFRPNTASFRVEFTGFLPPGLPLETPIQALPQQPLFIETLPASSNGEIRGTIHPNATEGLYVYEIHDGDGQVAWLNPIGESQNFGGVEIPDPPRPRQ